MYYKHDMHIYYSKSYNILYLLEKFVREVNVVSMRKSKIQIMCKILYIATYIQAE